MSKETVAGIDISSKWVDVSAERAGKEVLTARFANDAADHRRICRWLSKGTRQVRVVLEATSTYGLDSAMALHADKHIQVMVVNPRVAKDFAQASMLRAKTDVTAAAVLREFARRMPFVPWQPPRPAVLELRTIARRINALSKLLTAEKDRLHATGASRTASRLVLNDIEVNIRHLERRIEQLTEQATAFIDQDAELASAFAHLTSVKGIATTSAIQLLGELLVLPADMSVREWVAHAGLDPRPFQSGTSVQRPTRISKVGNVRLRRALYMPALVAVQYDPHVRGFHRHLIARGKTSQQANVAVMRKLLHAIHGMLRSDADFIGEKFFHLAPDAA